MKKTKIICTMGPNTENEDTLREMIIAGMDVARFNFSHGTHEEQLTKFNLLKKVREELNIPVAAMLDTKGPEIRTGKLVGGEPVCLEPGSEYTLTTREVIGDASVGHVTYDGLPEDVSEGDKILIDDGLIELTVLSIEDTDIRCRVYNGGMLGQQKGVNVPGVHVRLPDLTEQDQKDIVFAIEHDFDFIAASFVRSAECIHSIRRILNSFDSKIQIIAKIENQDGVEHLDEILEASDGIMVARGDMGVEIPPEDVPHVQKQMIARCNAVSKPVITATQMLDSMIRNPRPTRAEVADVANAIYDGTDVIMLSGESAVGKYPVEAVKMMVKIAETTEKFFDHAAYREKKLGGGKLNITNTVCLSSVSAAAQLNARCILAPTLSGYTCRMLSKWRPDVDIVGLTPNDRVLRQMQILWGVRPVKAQWQLSTEQLAQNAVNTAKERGYVTSGDTVVMTTGVINNAPGEPLRAAGYTNMMRVLPIE